MNNIILQNELIEAISNKTYIKNGDVNSCEGMKYDFRLGNRVLRADFKRPMTFSDNVGDSQKDLVVSPGEVAFVMTEETLELPNNIFCQLSSKRKLSHDGIIILGGFTVDPGYKGKLVFGLYNISSKDYPLIPGKKLVAGVFYKFDEEIENCVPPMPLYDFPDELVRMINEYKPVTSEYLMNKMEKIEQEILQLRTHVNSDKEWREDFKKGLKTNSEQISQIGTAVKNITEQLSGEIEERKSGIGEIQSKLSFLRGMGFILGGLVGGVIVAVLGTIIPDLFR